MVLAHMLMPCALWLSTPTVAEDSVDLPLRWTAGEKLHYEITKTRKKTQRAKVTATGTTRTDLQIEVVAVDREDYMVTWTHGATRFDDPEQAANPLAQQMGNLLKDFPIRLQLNSQSDK